MKSRIFNFVLQVFVVWLISGCRQGTDHPENVRPVADTIGFAQYPDQMDEIVYRIQAHFGHQIDEMVRESGIGENDAWKVAICPHDDYAYAGFIYPAALRNVKAGTVILFGVAHKARLMNLENQLIFDSYDAWKGPYGDVTVSGLREEIIRRLPPQSFQVNDSMHRMEHSLEALIPFLQFQNRNIEIVPILVPYMPYERMNNIAIPLAEAIREAVAARNLQWGKDFALVISNDAVHYGDEDWGGKNYAQFGTDSTGYLAAVNHEREIISAITGELKPENIKQFCNYTVEEQNFREYKWPWCGRYSVPFGLLTAFHLNHLNTDEPLTGFSIGYATSIDHQQLEVVNLGMGVTAPANLRHWVGYAAVGFR